MLVLVVELFEFEFWVSIMLCVVVDWVIEVVVGKVVLVVGVLVLLFGLLGWVIIVLEMLVVW